MLDTFAEVLQGLSLHVFGGAGLVDLIEEQCGCFVNKMQNRKNICQICYSSACSEKLNTSCVGDSDRVPLVSVGTNIILQL